MRFRELPTALGITILLIVNSLIYDLGLRIPGIIGIALVLLSYALIAIRPVYSRYLFLINESYSTFELFLITASTLYSILLSLLVIMALMAFLILNRWLDTRVFPISLITLALALLLTYYLYMPISRVVTTYVIILGINADYFALMLSSSLSILILFLIILILKKVIPSILHH